MCICDVDILMTIKWTCEEWNKCPSSLIQNCFMNFLKQLRNKHTDTEKVLSADTIRSMEQDANEHGVQSSPARLNSVLNQEVKNVWCKFFPVMIRRGIVVSLPEQTSLDPDHEKVDESAEVHSLEKN